MKSKIVLKLNDNKTPYGEKLAELMSELRESVQEADSLPAGLERLHVLARINRIHRDIALHRRTNPNA
jgi:hypothetical protein